MVEAVKRPLSIPPKFFAFFEKHHLHELFYELTSELVIKQPQDHILFLKQALHYANKTKNRPRVILLSSPFFDKQSLGQLLAEYTGIEVVNVLDFYRESSLNFCKDVNYLDSDVLTIQAVKKLKNEPVRSNGWVLVDFPRSVKEAKSLLEMGVLPTVVLQLIPDMTKDVNSLDTQLSKSPELMGAWHYYRSQLPGMRNAFRRVLKECDIRGRNMEQLASHCSHSILIMRHCRALMLPRVAIIGARGSGRNTQAKLLVERFDLIHVDMLVELKKAQLVDKPISRHNFYGFSSFKDVTPILENRLMKKDCVSRGWVLTGFPSTASQMKAFDQISTPPNRIIILDVPFKVCKDRVVLQNINMYTGSQHNVLTDRPYGKLREQTATHPADMYCKYQQQENEFREEINDIYKYCGPTAIVISGDDPVTTVFEKISSTIIQPSPPASNRGIKYLPQTKEKSVSYAADASNNLH